MKRVLLLALAACGTLADEAAPATDVPSAEMGPFRALQNRELKGTAPFVLDDSRAQYTDAAALADGAGVILFAVSGGKIVKTRSFDGRTFYGIGQAGKSPAVVLAPDEPWEGAALAGPFALRRDAEVLLFYAGAGGIGLARSRDGVSFEKSSAPILAGAVGAPTVFALPSGALAMLFTTASGLEEARSGDGGATWTRLPGVVLGPSGLVPGAAEPFDSARVADPVAATRITPAGRFHVRVLYTGTAASGATAIGFAARYGEDGPLTRNPQPAFPSGAQPAYAPPFLYVTQTRVSYPAIAAAIEPLDAQLVAPSDYPPSP
ncbi:MAG: hypothetical protein U0270_39070 [Labilithrix sp.]